MNCPVCKTHGQYVEIDLHAAESFAEDINTCKICGAVWSVSHGATMIIKDPQEHSFLGAISDCVETDDYDVAIA